MRKNALQQAWRHSDYALAEGIHNPFELLSTLKMNRGDSLYDFGCGDGSVVEWMNRYGVIATGLDIVPVYDEVYIQDLTEDGYHLQYRDFGICLGVMDHIPEVSVSTVLRNIRSSVADDVYFTIPIRDLGYNDLFGKIIQHTIKPIGWWRNKLTEIGIVKIGQTGDWMTAHVKRS